MKKSLQPAVPLLSLTVLLGLGATSALGGPGPATPRLEARQEVLPHAYLGSTVELDDALLAGVEDALDAGREALPGFAYFAVSGLRQVGDWAFVSVVGTNVLDDEVGWRLRDASFWGLVVARRDARGEWFGGVEGTEDFSELLGMVPDSVLSPRARLQLDPIRGAQARMEVQASYIFPFAKGYSIAYGPKGVHTADYSSMWGTSTWKAVDWWSDGGTGHAPNKVYAATAETVTGAVCADGTSTAVKTAGFIYAHFVAGTNLYTGQTFAQGALMGSLKTGSFSASCGYGDQAAGSFHLHWGFPNQSLTVEGWTLNPASGTSAPWVKGTSSVSPGGWIAVTWSGGGTTPTEVIVDDKSTGFTRYGTASYWKEASIGYNSHMYWTYVNGTTKDNYARWKPTLTAGTYKVCVYVPSNYATSQKAKYKVVHSGATHTFTINQGSYYNAWVCPSTASYAFNGSGSEYVELADNTGEAGSTGRMLGFDAVKFVK